MNIGNPSSLQKDKKMLVSCMAAYRGRSVPTGVQHLINSCKKFGIQLTLFGCDQNFSTMWNTKFCLLESYLKQTEADWILNVDANDILFIKDLEYIWEQRNEDKVIWAAEKNNYPNPNLIYPECKFSTKYINGGGFFGKKEHVLKCFDSKLPGHMDNDQTGHANNYLTGKLPMTLDSECKIFQCLWGTTENDFDIRDGLLYNIETGSYPCILHGNGSNTDHAIYKALT